MKILVVDDEETLCDGLRTYLELNGYLVDTALSAEQAMSYDLSKYSLVLLDVMMGGMSGMDMASVMKKNPSTALIPIIFLTAKDSDDDMVAGLTLGADDYIVKPYSLKNVMARIEAVLRRCSPRKESAIGVECDRNSLTCTVDGNAVAMPRKEFEILALMLENRGRIFSREELLDKVWPDKVVVADRSVDVHVTRIRGKLGKYGKHIISRSGYGYGWQD